MVRISVFFPLSLSTGLLIAPMAIADGHDGLPHAFEAGWKGEDTCEVLFENEEVTVGRCTFAPGIGHEKHYHNPHFGYTLQGGTTFRITDASGTQELEIPTGTTWSTDEMTVHEAVNIGGATASYLIVEPKPSHGK